MMPLLMYRVRWLEGKRFSLSLETATKEVPKDDGLMPDGEILDCQVYPESLGFDQPYESFRQELIDSGAI